jgi:hypothetical protein
MSHRKNSMLWEGRRYALALLILAVGCIVLIILRSCEVI